MALCPYERSLREIPGSSGQASAEQKGTDYEAEISAGVLILDFSDLELWETDSCCL